MEETYRVMYHLKRGLSPLRLCAMSLLVGVAANRSIATGQRVAIDDLLAAPVGAR